MPETALSDLAVTLAAPTIEVDGQVDDMVNGLLIGMQFCETEWGLNGMQLRFSNIVSDPDGGAATAFEDERFLALGKSIAVMGGNASNQQELFRGTITGLEAEFPELAPPELLVLAEDALQQARLTRRTRVHEDVSIADLAESLARDINLTPNVTGFTESIGTWVQFNESDLAFVRRVLARYDGELQVVGGELQVAPRNEVQRDTVDLELYSQLRNARVIADLAHQTTSVSVSGWDAAQGQRINVTSTGSDNGPGEGRSGSEVLETFMERTEHLSHLEVGSEVEGQAMADALYDRRARRFVCVEGLSEGNPRLRVGVHVTLSGLGNRFDNTYYIVRVVHRYDPDRGYKTEFEAECAFLGAA